MTKVAPEPSVEESRPATPGEDNLKEKYGSLFQNMSASKIAPAVEDPSFAASEEDQPVVWFYKDGTYEYFFNAPHQGSHCASF